MVNRKNRDECDIPANKKKSAILSGGINTMAMSRKEIFEKVSEALVDALGVDEEDVTNEATLMNDLDAESIDFLDIVFRLEKTFGIKIAREELFPAENVLANPEYVNDGKLTDAGIGE